MEVEEAAAGPTAPVLDEKRIQTKLHHCIKVAKSSAKKVKQFELQKHVRRLKQNKDKAATNMLEQELSILKNLDVQYVGVRALSSKLAKSKLIPKPNQQDKAERFPLARFVENTEVDPASIEKVRSPTSSVEERVLHQVLSSKIMAEEMTSCVKALASLVTPKAEPKAEPTKEKKKKEKKVQEEAPSDVDYESDDGMGNENPLGLSQMDMDAMVASGSESDESDDDVPISRKRPHDSEEEEEDSAFLPSLHTGFIPAEEGDDWSDAEADYADTAGKGPAKSQRKNRRGQRERRAIWEKKYGRHANHLKLREKEPKKERKPRGKADQGWPSTQGQGARPALPPVPESMPRFTNPRAPTPKGPPVKATEEPSVHPSWLAKQRAKEAQLSAKPAGTKIVFE